MKKKTFYLLALLSLPLLAPFSAVAASNSFALDNNLPYISEVNFGSDEVQTPYGAPKLTHYWTDGWTKFGSPKAPAVAYFNGNNGYHGYLTKYKEMPRNYGTQATYHGYFYHISLPLPSPSYSPLNYLNSFLTNDLK